MLGIGDLHRKQRVSIQLSITIKMCKGSPHISIVVVVNRVNQTTFLQTAQDVNIQDEATVAFSRARQVRPG